MGAGGIYRPMGRKCAFTAKLMRQKRSLDMRFERAMMTSRREFLSNALGTALVTASTWSIRAEAHSMHGQSDSSTSKSPRTTQNISLRWDVFLAPSIPAITSDLPPAEKQRPWPPISSTLISSQLAIAEELTGNIINLEGHDLVSVPLGFTDTASTTCLHVPSTGLIVAGDAAYNGVHLHLSESPDQQKRQEWIAALDKMESLKPRAVIAGHKRVGNVDSPKILGETRRYIRDFERLAMQTRTPRELYDQMLKLYPDWGNRGALWTSVGAVKP